MNESAQFYKNILNHLDEGVYFVDRARNITFWNQGAYRISGYSAEEVLHKPCYWNFLMHTDAEGNNLCEGRCPLVRTMEDGTINQEDIFLRHKDGRRILVAVKILPIKNQAGQVVGAVELFNDSSSDPEQDKKIKTLATLAYFDLVTGLANRRYAESRLSILTEEHRRNMITFGVLIIHIEGYKRYNDEHGQAEGDQLLAKIARALVAEVGPSDILVRWDGARFMLICPNTKKAILMLLAGKIKLVVQQTLNEKLLTNDRYLRVYAAGTLSRTEDTAGTAVARVLDYIGQKERANDEVLID